LRVGDGGEVSDGSPIATETREHEAGNIIVLSSELMTRKKETLLTVKFFKTDGDGSLKATNRRSLTRRDAVRVQREGLV
jgi:hypothetical protein